MRSTRSLWWRLVHSNYESFRGKAKLLTTFHFEIYCILCQIANRFQFYDSKPLSWDYLQNLKETQIVEKYISDNCVSLIFCCQLHHVLASSPLVVVLHFIWIGKTTVTSNAIPLDISLLALFNSFERDKKAIVKFFGMLTQAKLTWLSISMD